MRRAVMLLLLLLPPRPAWPDPAPPTCDIAGQAAERDAALPANMLRAIGLVESGRADPVSSRFAPWPWSVNVDGAGRAFASEADAAAFVRLAQSSGAGDIDIGCFQVSLRYHPTAFASLDQAFDPAANAAAAAAFLTQLHTSTGSWTAAVADYHSAAPELGLPYQRRVLAAWRGLGNAPALDFGVPVAPADLVVVEQAPAARLVHVFTMGDFAVSRPGLPRVISP